MNTLKRLDNYTPDFLAHRDNAKSGCNRVKKKIVSESFVRFNSKVIRNPWIMFHNMEDDIYQYSFVLSLVYISRSTFLYFLIFFWCAAFWGARKAYSSWMIFQIDQFNSDPVTTLWYYVMWCVLYGCLLTCVSGIVSTNYMAYVVLQIKKSKKSK